jgi:hypothetical protein
MFTTNGDADKFVTTPSVSTTYRSRDISRAGEDSGWQSGDEEEW